MIMPELRVGYVWCLGSVSACAYRDTCGASSEFDSSGSAPGYGGHRDADKWRLRLVGCMNGLYANGKVAASA